MVRTHQRFYFIGTLTTSLLLAACTGSDNSSATPTPSSAIAAEDESADTATDTAPSTTLEATSTSSPSSVEEGADESIAPLRPRGDPPPSTAVPARSPSAYISRVSMSASSIEVTWSDEDGAVAYHIHRVVRTSDDKPDVQAMTSENEIHVANDLGRFVDSGVEADTRYWYGVRALASDGSLVAHGWHPAAAVDDEEPPAVVPDLIAVRDGGEVLITWSVPEENYQLHGYRIFRGVDGAEPEQVAITWQIDQTSFIDDELPTAGEIVYEIVSFDFHWNDSLPGRVTIEQ